MLYSKLAGKLLGSLIFIGATFLGSCNDSKSASVATKLPDSSTSTTEQTQPEADGEIEIFADDSSVPNERESTQSTALLSGKWSPALYIDPNGQSTELSGMPEAERAEFRWEFTPNGRVFSGNEEGEFTVEGETLSIENLASGEITKFQFFISENELTLISDTNATLKLNRRSE